MRGCPYQAIAPHQSSFGFGKDTKNGILHARLLTMVVPICLCIAQGPILKFKINKKSHCQTIAYVNNLECVTSDNQKCVNCY